MNPDPKPTPGERLAAELRCRLAYDLAPIAVIGPRAGEIGRALRGVRYERIWQRESPDAVLSLYQPGRLFDAIVLADCLGSLCGTLRPEQIRGECLEPNRGILAFDQIDASLAAAGFVCVTIAGQDAERLDRHQPTTDHRQLTTASMDSLMRLFAAHGFQLHVMQTAAPPEPAEKTLIGIFSRRGSSSKTVR